MADLVKPLFETYLKFSVAEGAVTDVLDAACKKLKVNWDDFTHDCYDNSIEIYGVFFHGAEANVHCSIKSLAEVFMRQRVSLQVAFMVMDY